MKDSELSKTDDMREWGKPQWTDKHRGAQEMNRRKTQARGDQKQ